MKKNGFAPLIIILVIAILGMVGYFGYKNTISPLDSPVICVNQENTPGSYISKALNLSFIYPLEWGSACNTVKKLNGTSLGSDNIKFEKNSSLYTVAGDVERGGVINGVDIKLSEKTKLTTLDNHEAEIKIYKNAEDSNQNWIEAYVLSKENESSPSPEIFYIKLVGSSDNNTVLRYKDQFSQILSSFKFTK